MKTIQMAALALIACATLGASTATADSSRHVHFDDEARVFRAIDPSGQLMVEWYYTGDHGDWVRENADGTSFLKAQVNDATIVVYANVGGSFTPVGEGEGHLNLTSIVVPTSATSYTPTGERLNIQSHGIVETFAGTWDFRVSAVMREGVFIRLEVSPPPF